MNWINQDRVERFSKAALTALAIALLCGMFLFPKSIPILNQGDFPAFYSAGKIVSEGQGMRLYDFSLQQKYQHEYWPDKDKGHYFSYPPYTALFFAPLACMTGIVAKQVYIFMMLCFVTVSVSLVTKSKNLNLLRGNLLGMLAYTLLFFPILISIVGGQNTSWSMLCVAGVMYGLSLNSFKGDWVAGAALGLWLFKPHYALMMLPILLLSRRWRVLGGVTVIVCIFYLAASWVSGWGWLFAWLRQAAWFSQNDLIYNASNIISVNAVIYSITSAIEISHATAMSLHRMSLVLSIAVLVVIALKKAKIILICKKEQQREILMVAFLGLLPAMLALSPHTTFYDTGIMVFPMAWLARNKENFIFLILVAICMDIGVVLRQNINTQALFIVPLIAIYIKFSSFVESATNNRHSY